MEGIRGDHIHVKGLAHIVLPFNHDYARRTAVKPCPIHPLLDGFPQVGLSLKPVPFIQILRVDARFQFVPLTGDIIRHKRNHVLHHPIFPVKGCQQFVILRHACRGVLRPLHQIKCAEAKPGGRIAERIRCRCSVFLSSAHADFLQSGKTVLT